MLNKFQNQTNPTVYGMALAFYNEWKKKPYTLTFKQIDTLVIICKEIGYPVRDKTCGVCLKNSAETVEQYIHNYQQIQSMTVNGMLSNYDPKQLYKDKTILLLGNGQISKKVHAQKKKYNIIVGINQIYKSSNYKYIDVHYHALSKHDTDFLENYKEISNDKLLILKPTRIKPQLDLIREIANENPLQMFNVDDKGLNKKIGNPLSGIWILEDILEGEPTSIDILGFDFYSTQNKTYEVLPNNPKVDDKVHNLEANKKHFNNLLAKHKNITYHA
jgi:hypothetical protein